MLVLYSLLLSKEFLYLYFLSRYGTDASFYRLVPEVVVLVESESEVQNVVRSANSLRLPVTFRAAGTSLSGQAGID
jgi:D-lactate dehydrogenase